MLSAKFNALACLYRSIAQETEKIEKLKEEKQTSVDKTSTNEFLTSEQVMEILDISDTTLYWHRRKRGLKFIKKGKNIYYRKSDLDKWMSENTKGVRHVR